MEAILGFTLAALALAGSPGPNTLALAAVGSGFGRGRGMGFMVGLNIGMALVIAITGSGISAVILSLPVVRPVILIAAVAYFIWLAWRIATAPPLGNVTGPDHAPRWHEGVVISLINPKAYAAMGAMFATPALTSLPPMGDALLKASLLWAVIWFVNICWLMIGAAMTPWFRDPKTSRAINIAFAIALLIAVSLSLLV
ncbi:LysE family transporter [uncultured Shimia sp.]|uniref:LysE family translocator n=1 Tax=uncultured Shimia sp. TaxID=573152 RepID=UPI0026239835|nr:LysE family transporter [uncultured Shimia sp.]